MRLVPAGILAAWPWWSGCFLGHHDSGEEALRPNVLVVVLDDLGVDNVAAYDEHPLPPRTPTLDALAAEGVLFRRFYTNQLCSPSRASLITGLQPYDNGVNTHLWPWDENALPTDLATLPEALDGYASAAIGKWHLGGRGDSAPEPSEAVAHGFGRYDGNPDNFGWREEGWGDSGETYWHYERLVADPTGSAWSLNDGYATTDEVDAAIEATRSLEEPWLVWVGLHAPHVPNHVPPPRLNPGGVTWDDPDDVMYDAMVEAADLEIGRLLEEMPPGVRDRTTVFVLGDNGSPQMVVDPVPPWAPGKNTPYESGIRAPLIVSGRGVAPWGEEVDDLVSHTDLFATVVDLAGGDAPAPEDSHSFADRLWPDGDAEARDAVYLELREEAEDVVVRDDRVVVGERYKLVRQLSGERLHDLATDPGEQIDLLEAGPLPPEIGAELDALRAEIDRHDRLAGR